MRSLVFALAILSLYSAPSLAQESQKVCILNFDYPDSDVTASIAESIPADERILWAPNAMPYDIRNCFLDPQVKEIVIVGHSMNYTEGKSGRGLKYFLPDEEMDDGFRDHVIPESIFSDIAKKIKKQGTGVVSLRIMACDVDDLLETYPALQNLINDSQIHLDVSPTFAYFRPFGRNLSTFDLEWIKESFQFLEDPTDHVDVFMGLGNVFPLIQSGSRKVLRGQYLVGVNGLAFGFSYYYSLLRLPKSYFEGLKVGEHRKYAADRLKPGGALAFPVKSFVFEEEGIAEKGLSSNLGATLRLNMEVHVTRLY